MAIKRRGYGDSEINMAGLDPRRFGGYAPGDYTKAKSHQDYEHMYALLSPGEQHAAARPLRTSALYKKLESKGAQFAEAFGWERARWFDPSGKGEDYSFRRSNWFDPVADECRAVRERVGILDLSSFAKFEIQGPDARAYLDRITANGAPPRVSAMRLTHMLTPAGMIEAEMTVTRLAPDHFYALSGATAELKDFDLLHNPEVEGCQPNLGGHPEKGGAGQARVVGPDQGSQHDQAEGHAAQRREAGREAPGVALRVGEGVLARGGGGHGGPGA